jgi:hypothetical protein
VAGGQRAKLAIGGPGQDRRAIDLFAVVGFPDDAVRGVGAAGRLPDLARRRRHRNEIEVVDVAARRLRPAIVRRN